MTRALSTSKMVLRPRRFQVMTGPDARFSHACAAIAQTVAGGRNVLIIDAGNACNVFWLSRIARWLGLKPDYVLSHVFLARAFTCYQTAALLQALPTMVRDHDARAVVVVGLLETFFDEQVPLDRAVELLRQSIRALREARSGGQAIMVIQKKDERYAGPRLAFFRQLYQEAEGQIQLMD